MGPPPGLDGETWTEEFQTREEEQRLPVELEIEAAETRPRTLIKGGGVHASNCNPPTTPAMHYASILLPLFFFSAAMAAPNRNARAFDVDAIHNKVRSGAIAIANQQRPVDERTQRVQYRNGDVVGTTIAEVSDGWQQGPEQAQAQAQGA